MKSHSFASTSTNTETCCCNASIQSRVQYYCWVSSGSLFFFCRL